jgi:hypothetical protein
MGEASRLNVSNCHGGYSLLCVCIPTSAVIVTVDADGCRWHRLITLTRCWAPVLRNRLDTQGYPGISRGYMSATYFVWQARFPASTVHGRRAKGGGRTGSPRCTSPAMCGGLIRPPLRSGSAGVVVLSLELWPHRSWPPGTAPAGVSDPQERPRRQAEAACQVDEILNSYARSSRVITASLALPPCEDGEAWLCPRALLKRLDGAAAGAVL